MTTFELIRNSSLPLHMQLLDELRHKVVTGVLKPHERLPGEWELASELNISRATVQKAWHAAEEENLLYRIPGKGTFVAEPRPQVSERNTIAMIVPDFRGTFAVQLLSGVERILRRNGFTVHLSATEYRVDEENRLLQQMLDDGVRGCILWAMNAPHSDRLLKTVGQEMPIVLIDRPVKGIKLPCVTSNNYMGGRLAVEHLIEMGHENIVFLGRPNLELWTVQERHRAYQDVLRESGLPVHPPVLIGDEHELSSYDAYVNADETVLAPLINVLRSPKRPTAIFAVNDWMAMRVFRAAHMANVRIPDEVSLVGFDNLDVSEYMVPPLTTVAQNTDLLGSEAARRLLTLMEGDQPEETITMVPPHLTIRQSVKNLKNAT
jgi:DNA-binding LacI/PurR family transcriptional regulator